MSGDLFEALWVYATFGCWHERTDDFVWKWDWKLNNLQCSNQNLFFQNWFNYVLEEDKANPTSNADHQMELTDSEGDKSSVSYYPSRRIRLMSGDQESVQDCSHSVFKSPNPKHLDLNSIQHWLMSWRLAPYVSDTAVLQIGTNEYT